MLSLHIGLGYADIRNANRVRESNRLTNAYNPRSFTYSILPDNLPHQVDELNGLWSHKCLQPTRFSIPMTALNSSSINNIGDGLPHNEPHISAAFRNNNDTIPYHGNCAKCHHLHTSKAIILPIDRRKHERICCDACGYYMGGLGGNSTQVSLASVETILDGNRATSTSVVRPVNVPCSNTPGPSMPGADTATVDNDPDTNPEANSREQASVGPSLPLTSDANNNEGITSPPEITAANNAAVVHVPALEDNGNSSLVLGTSGKSRKARIREILGFQRLSEKRKRDYSFTAFGFRLNISREFTVVGPSNLGPTQTHLGQENENQVPRSRARSIGHDLERNEMVSHRFRHPDEMVEEEQSRAAKLERIRVIRREKTKQTQTQQGPTCKCDENCHCMSGNQGSTDTSNRRRESVGDLDVPLHSLHNTTHPERSRPRPPHENPSQPRVVAVYHNRVNFRGLGGHFDPMGAQSGTDSSGSAGRTRSRTSQATTAVGSTGSAISLEPGPSLRRSNSMPVPIAHQPTSQYRPEVRDALHNIHMFEATVHPYGMLHLEPLPENHHGEQSPTLGDRRNINDMALTDAEPTSLARIPSPDATQDGSPNPSAPDPGPNHTSQGGSNDLTPRARSQHDADDGSSISLEQGPSEVYEVLNEVAERTSGELSSSVAEGRVP